MSKGNKIAALTVFASLEKYACKTASLCPANVFGRKPSKGSKVNSRAVMSREVVIKHLCMSERLWANKPGGDVLGVRRPLNAQDLVMMAGVSAMKVERSKFSDEMIGRAPDLDVRVMGDRNVSRDALS